MNNQTSTRSTVVLSSARPLRADVVQGRAGRRALTEAMLRFWPALVQSKKKHVESFMRGCVKTGGPKRIWFPLGFSLIPAQKADTQEGHLGWHPTKAQASNAHMIKSRA